MRFCLNPFKKEKTIVIFHLIVGIVAALIIAAGILFYYVMKNNLVANILFSIAAFGLLLIILSSTFFLKPFTIHIKNEIIGKALFIFVKYFIAIISVVLVVIFARDVRPKEGFDTNDVLALITSFVPMVFTILVVTLSRQNDSIYGMDSHDFRRYRRDLHFGLLEMTMIGVISFVIAYIFRMIEWYVPMWTVEGISVIYCIYFLIQEIPVITNHLGYLLFLICGIYRHEILFGKSENDETKGKKIENMAFKILEEKGLFGFYDGIKEK